MYKPGLKPKRKYYIYYYYNFIKVKTFVLVLIYEEWIPFFLHDHIFLFFIKWQLSSAQKKIREYISQSETWIKYHSYNFLESLWSSRQCVGLLDVKPGYEPQAIFLFFKLRTAQKKIREYISAYQVSNCVGLNIIRMFFLSRRSLVSSMLAYYT